MTAAVGSYEWAGGVGSFLRTNWVVGLVVAVVVWAAIEIALTGRYYRKTARRGSRETALRDLASNGETVAFHQGLIDGYVPTEREFCKGPERHIITSATEFMPCCNVVINQEPSPVQMTGWAFVPDTLHCDCGVEWRIVDGAEFGHLNPDGVTIERVAP